MSQQKLGFGLVRGGTRRAARGGIGIVSTLALPVIVLPIFLVAAFSSSQASAGTVIDLGTAQLDGNADSTVCFAGSPCDERQLRNANAYTATPYSASQTTANLSTAPSISTSAEADALKGGGQAPTSFGSSGLAQVTLDYYLEIQGPQNIALPVAIQANANMTVTGDLGSSSFDVTDYAHLLIDGVGLDIEREGMIDDAPQGSTTKSGGFSVDQSYNLMSNTAYEVFMQVKSSASVGLLSDTNIVSTASIDPSFKIGPGYSGYSIAFSGGIGAPVSSTPLPATLPLFASGLGILGVIGRRKRKV